MSSELKARINDWKQIENKLIKIGAKFLEEKDVVDTYFSQPEGKVLKLTDSNDGCTLIELHAKDGKFELAKQEKVQPNKKTELAKQFGIKCELKKKIRFFSFESMKISINLIEDVGDFLIVESENPKKEFFTEKLGIKSPEWITVSFDKLKN